MNNAKHRSNSMHIPPVSFKGTLSVYRFTPNHQTVIENYHTTKQQDNELVELAQENMKKNMTKPVIYANDIIEFKNKIEDITGKELIDYNPGKPKVLMLGGIPEDYRDFERYNSANNKIFYRDTNHDYMPKYTKVIVDTLEPEDRKKLADVAMKRIQKTLKEDYRIQEDKRLDADLIGLSNKQITDFSRIEKILAKTLFYLDGNIDRPDPIKDAPKLYNARQAYLALFNRLQKVIGTNLPEKENEEAIAVFTDEKMEYMKRAVGYLVNVEYGYD